MKKRFGSKEKFREYCKRRLKRAVTKNRIKRDRITSRKIANLIKSLKAKNILFYIPLKSEVDVLKLLQSVRRETQKNIFVPFMEGVSFKMVKFRLPLYKRRFGIREPKNSLLKVRRIDLAIVPVLGVDGAFRRVGFGKGMYDRFFESLPYRPYIAFVELDECFTKEIISEVHDIQADIYITPYKTIKRKR